MSIAIDPMIRGKLEQFIDRRRRWAIFYALMVGVVVWVLGVLLFTGIDAIWIIDRPTRSLLSLGTYVAAIFVGFAIAYVRLRDQDPIVRAAIEIEKSRPELRDQLLSAVELARVSEPSSSRSFISALQQNVSGKIRAVDVRSLLPLKLLTKPIACVSVALLTCLLLALIPQLQFGNRFARAIIPGFDIDRISRTQILIERPAPPSCTVPANDITAIVVRLEGELADEAMLEWVAEDGSTAEIEMHTTTGPSDDSARDLTGSSNSRAQATFATNLMVEQSPISYRISAGDGVTRWHRLEPRPRPEVNEFTKIVTPPEYTQLPKTTSVSPNGDLKYLVGTRVSLRVRFNMPVKDVVMRRMNLDHRSPLRADGDDWIINTIVDTDDRYQVLARSVETDFDNPLSPQHAISALEDEAPIAKWKVESTQITSSRPRRELASTFSRFNLTAFFSDEMPLASLLQEVSVNKGEWTASPLDGSLDAAEIERTWTWDLKSVRHKDRELKAGDVVETRVVAIDRKKLRGESAVKEYIISDHEFDSAKQARLNSWIALALDVSRWKKAVTAELVNLKVEDKKEEKPKGDDEDQDVSDTVNLETDRTARNELIVGMMDKAEHESEAAKLEALARTMSRVEDSLRKAAASDEGKRREFRWITSHADSAAEMAKVEVGHFYTMLLIDNLMRMSASIQPAIRESEPIDKATIFRYLEIAAEQYQELTEMIKASSLALPESTRNHGKGFINWINDQQREINNAISETENHDRARSIAQNTAAGLQNQRRGGSIDGQIASQQVERMKQMQNAIGWTRDPLNQMAALAEEMAKWQKTTSTNSDEVRDAKEKMAAAEQALTMLRSAIKKRLHEDGEIHRHRPDADQQYIADTHLLERVLEWVGEASFKPAEEKNMRDVYQEIAAAYHWLESGHDATQWGSELGSLARDDRWNANTPSGRIDSPSRIERFIHGLEYSYNGLQQAGLQWNELGPIGDLRWGGEMATLGNDITSRRWRAEESISAADKLDRHLVAFGVATKPLEPYLVTARNKLKAYLPSIAELARKTAQTLRESKVMDAAADDKQPASEEAKKEAAKVANAEADEKREQAEKAAEQLKESLTDEANVQQLTTDDGRRKARNADISSKAVEKKMDQVEKAAENAKTAATDQEQAASNTELNEKTEAAAKAMEQIAAHYEQEKNDQENADKESDPANSSSESESPLKALEEELGLTKAIDEQFARSDAIANALKSDPRELLKKLVQELKRNELMQQELEDITGKTMQEAQRSLAEQATRERELQLQLERSDPKLAVAKRELEEAIRRSAASAEEVERALLAKGNQAAESLRELPEQSSKRAEQAKQELRSASEEVREAINDANQVGSADNALLSELKKKAASVQETLSEASEKLRNNEQAFEEILADTEAKLVDKRRNEEKGQMENIQRQARDTQVQMARDQERRASQRQQEAENQARQSKSKLDRDEDQLRKSEEQQKREPNNEGVKNAVAQAAKEAYKAKANFEADQAAVELSKETSKDAKQHADEVAKTELPALDQSQPAAQLANSMQQKAITQLDKAGEQLKATAERIAPIEGLESNLETVASADKTQERVAGEVADAAQDLARAARHQQRLGQAEQAQSTAEAAKEVKALSEGVVAEATDALESAKQAMTPPSGLGQQTPLPSPANSGQATEARDALGQSQAGLKAQAEKLSEASQAHSAAAQPSAQASSSAPQSGSQQAAAESARQMAQTLDELDRSLSAAHQPPKQNDNSSSQPQAGSPPPQSPATLAAAARRQAQQLAMKRAQQGQSPAKSEGKPEGESEESSEAKESGDGNSTSMADAFGLESTDRATEVQWGKLRSREAEDVSEERRVEISPEYRRQIEAYFRVIAEKAKQ